MKSSDDPVIGDKEGTCLVAKQMCLMASHDLFAVGAENLVV